MTIDELIECYECYLSRVREYDEDNPIGGNKLPSQIIGRYKGKESEFLKLLSSENIEVSKLFLLVSILKDAVKSLPFNIQELFQCCLYLVKAAGNDLASHEPKTIFIDFLVKNTEEFADTFMQITHDDSYNSYLDWFLLAGYQIDKNEYIEVSINLLKRKDEESIRSVLLALSRAKINREDQIEQILNELENKLQNEAIEIRSYALRVIHSFHDIPESMHDRVLSIIEVVFNDLDDDIIHNTACLLRMNNDVPQYLESRFIDTIIQVNLENLGTLDQINWWLWKLVRDNKIDKALSFIIYWNNKKNIVINLSHFERFIGTLHNSPDKLNYLITALFLSQNYKLIGSFNNAWGNLLHRKNITVNVDLLHTTRIEKPALFLAKKAYSWLFIYSENMVSYIFSLLPYVNEDEREEISEVLRLLALNYPTLFDESFDTKVKSIDENEWLYILKEDIDKYFEALKALSKINELRTPKENRTYRNMLFQDKMRDSMEEAHEGSLLSFIATTQKILYGRGSISQFNDLTRQESVLKSTGHSYYLPLVLSLDPHNHSQLLKQYQKEDCQEVL